MQEYVDYIFFEIWCKAPSLTYDISLFDKNQDLKDIIMAFHYSHSALGDSFVKRIEEIFEIFKNLSMKYIEQLKSWYYANNNIEKLCEKDLSIVPVTYKELEVFNEKLAEKMKLFYKNLYNHNFLSLSALKAKIGEIDNHYDCFMKENKKGKCPYCGLNDMKGVHHSKREAYDHYLPKDIYPFNSINFKNLAPACHDCNSPYKSVKDPLRDKNGNRRKAFYSYAPQDAEISIEMEIYRDNLEELVPEDIDLRFSSGKHMEEIETWKDIFGIEERYKAKCIGDTAKYWEAQMLDEMIEYGITQQEALNKLKKQANRYPFQDSNFLKIAFLEACERKNLFCNS